MIEICKYLILAITVSGCISTSGDAAVDTTPTDIFSHGDRLTDIEWTNCKSFSAITNGPTTIYPYAPYPPGWEEPTIGELSEHYLNAAFCERISWGQYERGPIYTLFEGLSGAFAPDSCLEERYNHYSFMGTVWISDEEIAKEFEKVFDIPTYYAEFTYNNHTNDIYTEIIWTWKTLGGEPSSFTLKEIDGNGGRFEHIERMFWFNDTQLSYLSLTMMDEYPLIQAQPSYGHMEPPMIAASGPYREYVATSGSHPKSQWTGTIHSFKDYQCEEPISY